MVFGFAAQTCNAVEPLSNGLHYKLWDYLYFFLQRTSGAEFPGKRQDTVAFELVQNGRTLSGVEADRLSGRTKTRRTTVFCDPGETNGSQHQVINTNGSV